MDRRQFIGSLGTGITGLIAGCISDESLQGTESRTEATTTQTPTRGSPADEGGPSPESDETKTTTVSTSTQQTTDQNCTDGSTARGRYFETVHTDDDVWKMTASPNPVSVGDQMTIQMVNESDKSVDTDGSDNRTAIQFKEGGEWTGISHFSESAWSDAEASHQPGEGWEWTFEISSDSIEEVGQFSICTDIVPGTYRFIYWGITRDGSAFEHAIGTEFEVIEG